DARAPGEVGQGGVEQLAADVVEVHVHAVRRRPTHLAQQVALLAVDDVVQPEVTQPGDLVRPAGDADDAAPLRLGQLGDDAADRAGGCGDENRLAGLCAVDVRQAEVGGHPRHAEGTEPGGHRGDVEIEAVDPLPVGDGVLPHTEEAPDCVPDCEVGVVGGDDPPSGVGAHDLTD